MLIKLTFLNTINPRRIDPKTLPVFTGSCQVNKAQGEEDEEVVAIFTKK